MIIKTHGIRSGTAQRVLNYVVAQGANDHVSVLQDASDALLDADLFAQVAGHKNGVLHITISPDQNLAQHDLAKVLEAIDEEFGFSHSEPKSLVRHLSKRSNSVQLEHFHLVRPATDANGKVLDLYRSKKRDEYISRFLELRLGHRITPGKHNDFVAERFRERGMSQCAEQFAPRVSEKPEALMKAVEHQRANRVGVELLNFKKELKVVAALSRDRQPLAFAELLAKHRDLEIQQGTKRSRLLVKKQGHVICNANRQLRLEAKDVQAFVKQVEREIQNAPKKRTGGSRPKRDCSATRSAPVAAGSNRTSEIFRERSIDKTLARNDNAQSTDDNRRQPHTKGELHFSGAVVRGAFDKITMQGLSKAAYVCWPMVEDLKVVSNEFRRDQVKPLPDLDDPFLMIKLSEMLGASLASGYNV